MKKIAFLVLIIFVSSNVSIAQCVVTNTAGANDYVITAYFSPTTITCAGSNITFGISYNISVTGSSIPANPVNFYLANLTCGSTTFSGTNLPITNTSITGNYTTTGNFISGSNCATGTTPITDTPASLNCLGSTNINFVGNGPGSLSFNINCASIDVALPIRLKTFKGEFINGLNQLNWQIDEQINFDYFQVERGSTPKNFEVISPKIRFNNQENFEWKDEKPLLSQRYTYYRLKQMDLDGSSSYSKIIAVEHFDENMVWQASPNPSSENLTLSWNNKYFNVSKITIYNTNGKMVRGYSIDKKDSFSINASQLSNQSYVVSIHNKFGRKISKRIVLN